MRAILSSEQMVCADQFTIEELGIPALNLMEQAARACLENLMPLLSDRDVVCLVCGTGNNGGDGLALARLLKKRGFPVHVYALGNADSGSPEVQTMWQRLLKIGVEPTVIEPGPIAWPSRATWIVDAIFGTGLSRAISGKFETLIQSINQSSCKVLSVDVPSGLMGSSGSIPGPHVHANITVTFQSLKVVHGITPACLSCGMVEVADIGIQFPNETQPVMYSIEIEDYQREPRHLNAHKGSFGYLGVVGGASGMEGAVQLAARAALRFGAGKVKVLSPDPTSGRFHADSVMIGGLDSPEHFDALIIGPGLSRDRKLWQKLDPWVQKNVPMVWDADGLYYLAQNPLSGPNMVMTPHPGEAAMLLGISAQEVQSDRLAALLKLAERFPQSWILLKGFRSMIRSPLGQTFVVETGNPALATAGSGDVLAGMIGAMLAQGGSLEDSVVMATLRHGFAADRWVQSHCPHSMIAEDIIDDLKYNP